VAADGFRVGAVEQLRLYANIIDTPFVVARTPSELRSVAARTASPMLIDTAGRSPRDPESAEWFDALRAIPNLCAHLVVPAGMHGGDLARVFDAHALLRPDRIVVAKADETATAGAIARVLRDRAVPVSYITTGQRVPEDLLRATPQALAALLLGETCAERDGRV
jgi:flagellar biosynthesis protein FlhF